MTRFIYQIAFIVYGSCIETLIMYICAMVPYILSVSEVHSLRTLTHLHHHVVILSDSPSRVESQTSSTFLTRREASDPC